MSDAYTCTNTGHGGFVCRTCHGKTIQSLEQKVSDLEKDRDEYFQKWTDELLENERLEKENAELAQTLDECASVSANRILTLQEEKAEGLVEALEYWVHSAFGNCCCLEGNMGACVVCRSEKALSAYRAKE